MPEIQILVVDDHDIVRHSICELLTTESDLTVVEQASSGYEAVDKAEEHQPNIVLLDIDIPELNGLMAARLIKRVAPNTEILIMTSHRSQFFVREAFSAGALGFLSKSDLSAELIIAVRSVYSKKKFVSKDMRDELSSIIQEAG